MKTTKKMMSLVLAAGLVLGMSGAVFASDSAVVNLLPQPNKDAFNQVVSYNPALGGSTTVAVQGANASYLPEAITDESVAKGIKWTPSDGLELGEVTVKNASPYGYYATADVTIPIKQAYGPKMIKASLPKASDWTGNIDLGIVANPEDPLPATKCHIAFYDGRSGKLENIVKDKSAKGQVENVKCSALNTEIKYPSALDAAITYAKKKNVKLAGDGINKYITSLTINGVTLKNDPKTYQGWYYRVYDKNGDALKNSDVAGAEVFPVNEDCYVVYAYGSWGILGDKIEKEFL